MLRTLMLLSCVVAASPVLADTARSRLDAFAHDLRSATARFEQGVTGASGKRGETSSGDLALKAPRQFRWHTTAPYEQLIVADGHRVWIYDPDLEQASVRSQGAEEAHSPLAVLTDLSRLEHEFSVSEAGEREALQWLKLVSKADEPEFAFAELGFDDAALVRMRFEDALGNTTEIRFSGWQRNPRLAADAFSFAPPAGVDVIGDPGEQVEIFPIREN